MNSPRYHAYINTQEQPEEALAQAYPGATIDREEQTIVLTDGTVLAWWHIAIESMPTDEISVLVVTTE